MKSAERDEGPFKEPLQEQGGIVAKRQPIRNEAKKSGGIEGLSQAGRWTQLLTRGRGARRRKGRIKAGPEDQQQRREKIEVRLALGKKV